jgi:hypothetical protein
LQGIEEDYQEIKRSAATTGPEQIQLTQEQEEEYEARS